MIWIENLFRYFSNSILLKHFFSSCVLHHQDEGMCVYSKRKIVYMVYYVLCMKNMSNLCMWNTKWSQQKIAYKDYQSCDIISLLWRVVYVVRFIQKTWYMAVQIPHENWFISQRKISTMKKPYNKIVYSSLCQCMSRL